MLASCLWFYETVGYIVIKVIKWSSSFLVWQSFSFLLSVSPSINLSRSQCHSLKCGSSSVSLVLLGSILNLFNYLKRMCRSLFTKESVVVLTWLLFLQSRLKPPLSVCQCRGWEKRRDAAAAFRVNPAGICMLNLRSNYVNLCTVTIFIEVRS